MQSFVQDVKSYLAKKKLVVGEGTVIGANAVLTQSTGDWEIWAGIPAKKIGLRERCNKSIHRKIIMLVRKYL